MNKSHHPWSEGLFSQCYLNFPCKGLDNQPSHRFWYALLKRYGDFITANQQEVFEESRYQLHRQVVRVHQSGTGYSAKLSGCLHYCCSYWCMTSEPTDSTMHIVSCVSLYSLQDIQGMARWWYFEKHSHLPVGWAATRCYVSKILCFMFRRF